MTFDERFDVHRVGTDKLPKLDVLPTLAVLFLLALFHSIWSHQFDEAGLFFAPKLIDLYRTPSMFT